MHVSKKPKTKRAYKMDRFNPYFEVAQSRIVNRLIRRYTSLFNSYFDKSINPRMYGMAWTYIVLYANDASMHEQNVIAAAQTNTMTWRYFWTVMDAAHLLANMSIELYEDLRSELVATQQSFAKQNQNEYAPASLEVDGDNAILFVQNRSHRIPLRELEQLLDNVRYDLLPVADDEKDECALNLIFCLLERYRVLGDLFTGNYCLVDDAITICGHSLDRIRYGHTDEQYVGPFTYLDQYVGAVPINWLNWLRPPVDTWPSEYDRVDVRNTLPYASAYVFRLPNNYVMANVLADQAIEFNYTYYNVDSILMQDKYAPHDVVPFYSKRDGKRLIRNNTCTAIEYLSL